jgi:nitrous oxidase accessory protein NosD
VTGRTLVADGRPALVLDGGEHVVEGCAFAARDCGRAVVLVTGGRVTLRRCRIEGGINRGLVVEGGAVVLEDCALAGNRAGLWATDGAEVTARGCRFEGPGSVGMFVQRDARVRIEASAVAGVTDAGVLVRTGARCELVDCAIAGDTLGVRFETGATGEVRGCRIGPATVGVWVSTGATPMFLDCTIAGCTGFGLAHEAGGRVARCAFVGNNAGIELRDGADPDVVDCTVTGGTVGLSATAGARGRVVGCDIGPHARRVLLAVGAMTVIA